MGHVQVLTQAWLHKLSLHNPHNTPLTVMDIVSTDDFLRLHLPPPLDGREVPPTHPLQPGAAVHYLQGTSGEHVRPTPYPPLPYPECRPLTLTQSSIVSYS